MLPGQQGVYQRLMNVLRVHLGYKLGTSPFIKIPLRVGQKRETGT